MPSPRESRESRSWAGLGGSLALFEFQLGAAIPVAAWEERGLPDAVEDDDDDG
jgi:hypothetical protein